MIDTLSYLSDRFFYQKQDDLWHVMKEGSDGFFRGDDRDFAITLAYHLSGCSLTKMRLNIYTGRIRFWITKDGHVAIVFKRHSTCYKRKNWERKTSLPTIRPTLPFRIVRDPDFILVERL